MTLLLQTLMTLLLQSSGGTDCSDFISGKNVVVSDDFDLVSDTISDIFWYNVAYTLNITVACVKALKSENTEWPATHHSAQLFAM